MPTTPRVNPQHPNARGTIPIGALALSVVLGGCAHPLVLDQTLPQQISANLAENACINRCQATKDTCDDDARYDYAQCQAGYSQSFRNYRWCQASTWEKCGYPWWGCSENNYGYCTNRYWECRDACRRTHRNAG